MNLRCDFCSYSAAKYAVFNWHYSKCMPAGKTVRVGVWEDDRFIGVVIFSSGTSPTIGFQFNLNMEAVCELTRIALDLHFSPVTKILSIAVKLLRKIAPGLRLIVSYADMNEDHYGTIYQAASWVYMGEIKSLPKHKNIYTKKTLFHKTYYDGVKAGRYIKQDFVSVPQKMKFKYILPLDRKMRKQIDHYMKPYPKRTGSIDSDMPKLHLGEGGAIPTPVLQ